MLQGIPGITQTTRDFVQLVRLFTRDFPEMNRLIAGVESTDRQIAWAVMDALADFNGTPPFLGQMSIDDLLNYGQTNLLLRMSTISLIESVGLLQTRNHINYSTGGTSVAINDKTPLLMQWLQYFKATTEQMKLKVKVSMNIAQILGPTNVGARSEYWNVNGSYQPY